MQKKTLLDLAEKLMRKHEIFDHGFELKINEVITSYYAGCYAEGNDRAITLNWKMMHDKSYELCESIILHEIAHALDFIRNNYQWRETTTKTGKKRCLIHDKQWKKICREIGAPETACL